MGDLRIERCAGTPIGGNGAAIRAARLALVHRGDPSRISRQSFLQSVVAPRDTVAIITAAGQVDAAPCLLAVPGGAFAPAEGNLAALGDAPDEGWHGLDGGMDQAGQSEGRSRGRERTE